MNIPLGMLSSIQQRFDAEHGFDFSSRAGVEEMEEVVFSSLALAGEVGELANAIKKARRASWLNELSEEHLQVAASETGDVLAYLLKLCRVLRVDPVEQYLLTVLDNYLRFPVRPEDGPPVIAIAGPTGVGKTTLTNEIARRFAPGALQVLREDVTENPHLPLLIRGDAGFDAMENQMWFISRIASFLESAQHGVPVLFDQDPQAVARAYGWIFKHEGSLAHDAYLRLLVATLGVESRLCAWRRRRRVVFLDADERVLMERARRRGDASVMSIDWFASVRRRFLTLAGSNPSALRLRTDLLSVEQLADAACGLFAPDGRDAATVEASSAKPLRRVAPDE